MDKEKYVDRKMKAYRTGCCQAGTYSKGRATAFCEKCHKDVMMEMCLIADMYGRNYELYYGGDKK